jgi:xylan 1,4-beta-xylosidase
MPDVFVCDLHQPAAPFPHFWEHTVGSGDAALTLRADWQRQMLRCHQELGFQHVRFHGILSDNMGTLVDEMDTLVYSFFNTEHIFDFLLSIVMSPFVEFSFMPLALSSGDEIVFSYKDNVTPPKDYTAWETLITDIVSHWVDRYGLEKVKKWYFEIWNEPNLSAFWTGSQQDYFMLYKHAAVAIKKINPALQVGGPATASNAWITEFRDFCAKENAPYDFISTHHYPTDAFGKPGDDTITQLSQSKRSVLRDQVMETRNKAGLMPVYYTEWSTSSNPFDDLHDEPYAASFIIKTVIEARGQVEGYSYWTFSDIFNENYFSSVPFHGGFGLLTIYGIPKPAYRAFELLHRLGNEFCTVEGSHSTIDVWVMRSHKLIQVMITNSVLPRHPVATETVSIELKNVSPIRNAYLERIDDGHCNSRAGWVAMGSPGTLKPHQVNMLEKISELVKETQSFLNDDRTVKMEIEMPPLGTALITVELL